MALARNTDPHTSHLAAREIEQSGRGRAQRRLVLQAVERFCAQNPRTSMEIALCSGLDRYLVARRLPELEEDGRVERRPARPCLASGRCAITWAPVRPQARQLTLFSET